MSVVKCSIWRGSLHFWKSIRSELFCYPVKRGKLYLSSKKTSLETKMDNISKAWIGPLPPDSLYCRPFRFYYVQNDVEKNWDLLKVHDSVSIIIFNKSRNVLVFVKQFRPAVYHGIIGNQSEVSEVVDLNKFPPKLGITLELCAGIVDKEKSWKEIAKEEVLEECGYNVPTERLEEVISYRADVGALGCKQVMYYCEVTDDEKSSSGGGVGDEIIEVVEYTIDQTKELVKQGAVVNSPPSFLFGVSWFLMNKAHIYSFCDF